MVLLLLEEMSPIPLPVSLLRTSGAIISRHGSLVPPKTIDGDLKCNEVPINFGFHTACKIYAVMIGNVMIDDRLTGKYYHFVRLMGRAASPITLECALQTHRNIALIGEEVFAEKLTLKNVTDIIVDVVCKWSVLGYNYGVILIPEGLIDFIPEVQLLVAELIN